jgi:serine/threonine protein kinase/Tol biopolymer transport system component
LTRSEYFRRIEAIYHESLRHEGEARSAFLRHACADNDDLRRHVERLLEQSESQHVLLDEQALGVAAQLISDGELTELIGRRLGPYQVLARIGAGGMGDVHRARDTNLGRDVAIKVLPAAFMSNANRRARFEREARVLASLNHPNIGAIYGVEEGDGVRAIVLELVEGETLAERLTRGPLPVKQALRIAREIADALDAAHEHGVVHRDLKPANVGLTRDGTVKVLDFGLAKLATGQADQSVDDSLDVPTGSLVDTRAGMVLGTPAYMSPEQARGERIDKRTDIWAFGCVLFEMLTGHTAFQGSTSTEILTAILERDADLGALPVATPANIQRLIARCLDKDTRQRLRDIGDARVELAEALTANPPADTPRVLAHASPRLAWLLAGAAVVAVGAFGYQSLGRLTSASERRAASVGSVGRFVEALGEGRQLGPAPSLAVSSDGRRIAYVAVQNGTRTLYVRELDQISSQALSGTEGADQPFFSPDGRWIGFFAQSKLKKVSVVGRAPVIICDALDPRGASWAGDDSIIFAPTASSALVRVSAFGGTPQPITSLDRSLNEASHRWPHLLPGGEAILFAAGPTVSARGWNEAHVNVQSLKSGMRRLLAQHGTYPLFAPTGHLLFLQDGVAYAQRFDPVKLEVTGEAQPLLERVPTGRGINGGARDLALSATGTLAYLPDVARAPDALVWVNRSGAEEMVAFPLPAGSHPIGPRLSPNARQLAVTVVGPTASEVWVYDIAGATARPLTDGGRNLWPVWAPDGKRVAYGSSREGSTNVYWKSADGNSMEERLTSTLYTNFPHSWSPDGKSLALTGSGPHGRPVIEILPMEGQRPPRPFDEPGVTSRHPAFSPDGRWVAYVSNTAGRNEVYVRAYPGPGTPIPISTDGGEEPVWARSGRELFFRRGNIMMAVDIVAAPHRLSAGVPKQLFSGSYAAGGTRAGYDVSADAQKFILIKSSGATLNASRFTVALNWLDELEARTSPGR